MAADLSGRLSSLSAKSIVASKGQMSMAYVPASDKMLIAKDSQLKLVARRAGATTEFFEDPGSTHFGNSICDISDEISLFLAKSDLDFVLKTLDFSEV